MSLDATLDRLVSPLSEQHCDFKLDQSSNGVLRKTKLQKLLLDFYSAHIFTSIFISHPFCFAVGKLTSRILNTSDRNLSLPSTSFFYISRINYPFVSSKSHQRIKRNIFLFQKKKKSHLSDRFHYGNLSVSGKSRFKILI